MATDKNNNQKNEEQSSALPPDPETLHKTDPQENMKGPISSVMQNLKKDGEKNDEQSREEAERKRDEAL